MEAIRPALSPQEKRTGGAFVLDEDISELLDDVPQTYATPEIREPCDAELKFDIPSIVARIFSEKYEVNTIDGARIKFDRGWGLVRASNTQSVLVLRAEAETEALKEEYLSDLRSAIDEAESELRAE